MARLTTRAAILVSGRGSNMAALLDAAATLDRFPAHFVCVISNQPNAPALARARAAGIEALAIDHRPFGRDRAAHEAAVDAALRAAGAEVVCLAGYLRLLTPWLVNRWAARMLNIHPSLLPALPGLDTHARALAAGLRVHGCTVHLVTAEMDAGPILAQAAVPVLPGDDEPTLAARVLAAEHRLYPAALAEFLRPGETSLPAPGDVLANPLPLIPPAPRNHATAPARPSWTNQQ